MQPPVIMNIEKVKIEEGMGRFKINTERTRFTNGEHLFIAVYIGIFIPENYIIEG